MRQIFLLIILFFVSQWAMKKLRRANKAGASPVAQGAGKGARRASSSGVPQLAEPMILCAECGVHAPKSESVAVDGKLFCGIAHAQRYAARPVGRDGR